MAAVADLQLPPDDSSNFGVWTPPEFVSINAAAQMARIPGTTLRSWFLRGVPRPGGQRVPLPIRWRLCGNKYELVRTDVEAWIKAEMTPR